jgi:hypothetical protein
MTTVTAAIASPRPAGLRPRPELGEQAAAFKALHDQAAELLAQARTILRGDVAVSSLSALAAALNRNADALDLTWRGLAVGDAILAAVGDRRYAEGLADGRAAALASPVSL